MDNEEIFEKLKSGEMEKYDVNDYYSLRNRLLHFARNHPEAKEIIIKSKKRKWSLEGPNPLRYQWELDRTIVEILMFKESVKFLAK